MTVNSGVEIPSSGGSLLGIKSHLHLPAVFPWARHLSCPRVRKIILKLSPRIGKITGLL